MDDKIKCHNCGKAKHIIHDYYEFRNEIAKQMVRNTSNNKGRQGLRKVIATFGKSEGEHSDDEKEVTNLCFMALGEESLIFTSPTSFDDEDDIDKVQAHGWDLIVNEKTVHSFCPIIQEPKSLNLYYLPS